MPRKWKQVKSDKHALGLTDSSRVAELKRETLDELEVARVAPDGCGHGVAKALMQKGDASTAGDG